MWYYKGDEYFEFGSDMVMRIIGCGGGVVGCRELEKLLLCVNSYC